MIELLNIIFVSFAIFTIFNSRNIIFIKNSSNIFCIISINLVIFLNICLILSFFDRTIEYLFYILIVLSLINIKYFFYNLTKFDYLFFILLNLCFFLKLSADPSLGWDGIINWYPKVYNFLNSGTFFTLDNYPRYFYPHLGPYIWAIFSNYSFLEHEYLGRFIYIFLYFASIFLVTSYNKNSYFKNFILVIILFIISFDFDLFKGYQEYLIFSLINIFVIFFYNESSNKYFGLISLLILNAMIWCKDEGLIYSVPILIMYLTKSKKILSLKNAFFIFFYCLIVIFKFLMMSYLLNNNQLGGFTTTHIFSEIFNFSTFLTDVILIFKHFMISFFKYPVWLFLILFLVFPTKEIKRKKVYKDALYIFVFCLFINFFIFHIQRTDLLEWRLITALDRLNLMISAYFLYFIYLNLSQYLQIFIKNDSIN